MVLGQIIIGRAYGGVRTFADFSPDLTGKALRARIMEASIEEDSPPSEFAASSA